MELKKVTFLILLSLLLIVAGCLTPRFIRIYKEYNKITAEQEEALKTWETWKKSV